LKILFINSYSWFIISAKSFILEYINVEKKQAGMERINGDRSTDNGKD
jgi:hypothetical protein